jgi:putative nucleotidyltransferase with HDIG domain
MLAQRTSPVRVFTRRDGVRIALATILLTLGLAAVLAIDILPTRPPVAVGDVSATDIKAPHALDLTSQALTEQARAAAAAQVPYQYDYTVDKGAALATQQAGAFATRVSAVDAAYSSVLAAPERAAILQSAVSDLSDASRTTLVSLTPQRWLAVRTEAARVLDMLERSELRDTDVAQVRTDLASRMGGELSDAERQLAAEIDAPLIVPNSSFSQELTDQKRAAAAAAIQPVHQTWSQNEIIVRNGERVTPLAYEAIQALGLDQSSPDLGRFAGLVLLGGLLVVALMTWLWRFRPVLWHRDNVLLLVALIVLFTAFVLKMTAGRSILPYFVPTAAVGMLVAILLDAWAATILTVVLALFAGLVTGSMELVTYTFLGGFAGILAIRRGDRLHVFVQAGIAVAVANILVVSAFGLMGQHDITGTLQLWIASIVSAAGAAVATVGSFAVLGNLFGITTVFQLLELANPSQPVLRRLLLETPGTYHHSLMVGNLAERAAESIGADPLVARVAAYYHDIGKLANPLAFIENQGGGDNIHDELDPEVSAQVLKQHVADGIDLAYRYHLPKTLIAFIPQHHGTALMSYFYAKARDEAAAPYGGVETPEGRKAADAVDVSRFRHAGPKPQTREAAVLMLSDAVEASVRSLASRDEPAIRAMVDRIIAERVDDGQFLECDLTLRDVDRIRQAFVSQLLGMYHQRIAYPQSRIVELESRRVAMAGAGAPGPAKPSGSSRRGGGPDASGRGAGDAGA